MLDNTTPKDFGIFDPCGIVEIESRPLATRKNTLSGLRLGILDNSKWNANKLLRGSALALSKEIEFATENSLFISKINDKPDET